MSWLKISFFVSKKIEIFRSQISYNGEIDTLFIDYVNKIWLYIVHNLKYDNKNANSYDFTKAE